MQNAPRAVVERGSWSQALDAFQGVYHALAAILAVRFMLLLALCGGFFLADVAMQRQTNISVIVLVAYAVLVIGPPSFLEYGRKFVKGD